MPRRFKEARVMNKMKALEAAEKLGVATPTLSAWESEKKSPPLDAVIAMAELYNVSTDFLLGKDLPISVESTNVIPQNAIALYHGRPVWVNQRGGALVNSIDQMLVFTDGHMEYYTDATLTVFAPEFTESKLPSSKPLSKDEVLESDSVWVEPITAEPFRSELRGTYAVKGEYVENTRGNRFYLDSYSATWIAFVDQLNNSI